MERTEKRTILDEALVASRERQHRSQTSALGPIGLYRASRKYWIGALEHSGDYPVPHPILTGGASWILGLIPVTVP